jgi:hypothetical protein
MATLRLEARRSRSMSAKYGTIEGYINQLTPQAHCTIVSVSVPESAKSRYP